MIINITKILLSGTRTGESSSLATWKSAKSAENLLSPDDTALAASNQSLFAQPANVREHRSRLNAMLRRRDGVLVHNTCDWRMWEKQAGKYFRRQGFDVVGSIRNASGHGIDMVLRNRTTKEIFVAEIKARSRRWGGLSLHQKRGAVANAQRILGELQGQSGNWAPHNVLPGSQQAARVLRAALDPNNPDVVFGGGYVLRINELMRGLRRTQW
ncbi:MAG: restriction endonuclease [Planctomycetaceae bacterium]